MSTIRSRIFFPVVVLIILFPILAWVLFSSTSGWYMDRIARQSLEELMDSVHSMAEEVYEARDMDTLSREEEKMYSKELVNLVKGYVRKGQPGAKLLALNLRLKLTFPKQTDYHTDTDAVYEACRDMIAGGTLAAGEGDTVSVSIGSRQYRLSLYETESSGNIRGKYLVGYVEIPDTKALLSYTGGLLLLIAGSLAGLSLLGAWLIAGSISRPLQALCGQARAIGRGRFTASKEHYTIAEIESLKEALDRMALELEEVEQRKITFFHNASHELRTPLMSICGYAQGIQHNVFTDHSQAAAVILSESMRMKELVDGILTISKLDSRQFEMQREPVCLDEFVRQEIETLKGIEVTEQISFELGELPKGPVEAMADPSLLSKAFRNVVSNCARYASGQVMISLEEEEGWHVIRVEDDGPGFAKEEFPHIFERFYKGKQGNFGIGLSIARASMEYMGGKVEADNRQPPLGGAVFRLLLPAYD